MSTLYLVRHGQAAFGTADYDRLSPVGRRQIAALRGHFTARAEYLDGLWCGSLRRQRDTAAILAANSGLEPRIDAAFDEYRADAVVRAWLDGNPSGAPPALRQAPETGTARDYQRLLEASGRAWIRGELDPHAGESWAAFRARVGAGLEAVMRAAGRGQRIAICTSAGVIGAAVGHVLGLDDLQSLTLSWSVHNASLTVLLFDARRTSLSSFNGLPHLEQPGLAELITYR
ncbi:MAG: histidine phosphatase family protein [Steroidobacteraceae bacterium]|nr:histidine phosphatase family protein [Nevskiaceae bacterium]MCP5338996.1 histidine phosphatase family protein [Nevskiaceae bacterium]MCP5359592.1 histidine phosphatase family protein [Nevskiaceae bacterium]MCP5472615.1 histidine phosphatase family protein [Nevskiaceae bacterium]